MCNKKQRQYGWHRPGHRVVHCRNIEGAALVEVDKVWGEQQRGLEEGTIVIIVYSIVGEEEEAEDKKEEK